MAAAEPAPSDSLGLTTDALQPDSEKTTTLLAGFKGGLRVTLIPNTRIIEIHYRSADKNLAANVVNTLINTYIEQNFKTRFESTMQASDWLSKQLVDLEMKVQTSQEKLVQYQKQHEILGIDEKQNITTSKLDELNKELTAAESDRMEKESVYRLVQSGDPDTAAAAATSAGSGNASSGLMEKMREQQADLKIQVAQLSTQFGNSYPKVVQLNTQLKEVDAQLQTEMTKVVSRVRSGYLAALQHETMLRQALDNQKQEANKLNESAIEYSLLKRDVESYRTLYEGLMEKLKEAGVTAGLRSNNIRSVDKARVPTYPSEPNVPRNLTFALALGLSHRNRAGLPARRHRQHRAHSGAGAGHIRTAVAGHDSSGLEGRHGGRREAPHRGIFPRSRGTGHPVATPVPDGGVLPRLAHFPVADLAGRTAQSDPDHQRPSSGGKNDHQH